MQIKLKVVKRFSREKVQILEDQSSHFLIFKAGPNIICARKAGNVILDSDWFKKIDRNQQFKLKDFLGGMYIEEVKKEIKAGSFKTGDLNSFFTF